MQKKLSSDRTCSHYHSVVYRLLPFVSQKVLSRSVGKSFTDKLQGVRQLFKSKNESQVSALKPPATVRRLGKKKKKKKLDC